MKVKNCLRDIRKKAGLTQEALAKALDVTRQTIISIENGEYVPSTFLALKISHYFRCRVEEIFWL
jgi:putative transcriptional regulator